MPRVWGESRLDKIARLHAAGKSVVQIRLGFAACKRPPTREIRTVIERLDLINRLEQGATR